MNGPSNSSKAFAPPTRWFLPLLALLGLMSIGLLSLRPFPQFHIVPIHYWLLVLSIPLHLLGHALRAEKMALFLRRVHPNARPTVYRSLMIGYFFNNALPFRVGELLRAHLVGKRLGISRTVVLILIGLERATDASFLGILLLTVGIFGHIPVPTALGLMLLVLGAGILGIVGSVFQEHPSTLRALNRIALLFNPSIRNALRLGLWSAIRFLHVLWTPSTLLPYLGLSVLMWTCYLGSILLMIGGLFPNTLAPLAVAVDGVAASVSIPVPVGLLPYTAVFLHMLQSLATPQALLLAGTLWLVLVVPSSLVGALVLATFPTKAPLAAVDAQIQSLARIGRTHPQTDDFHHFLDSYFDRSLLVQALNTMEAHGECTNVRIFNGGSHALTALVTVEGQKRVRKIVALAYRAKLADQAQWLESHRQDAGFPDVLAARDHRGCYLLDIAFDPSMRPFFDTMHHSNIATSWAVLERVLTRMSEVVWASNEIMDHQKTMLGYIETKIVGKINDVKIMHPAIAVLAEHSKININGQWYPSLDTSLQKILQDPAIMAELSHYGDTPLHGDLTVDNLLVNPQTQDFLILDPNNENSVQDVVVDIAKLYQSLHSGYEFLRDVAHISINDSNIAFAEHRSGQYTALFDRLDQHMRATLGPERHRAILFHEAVHYCRMLPYRVAINPQTAALFYAVATRLLHAFLEQYPHHTHRVAP